MFSDKKPPVSVNDNGQTQAIAHTCAEDCRACAHQERIDLLEDATMDWFVDKNVFEIFGDIESDHPGDETLGDWMAFRYTKIGEHARELLRELADHYGVEHRLPLRVNK